LVHIAEERVDKMVKFFARCCELKGAAMEQFNPEIGFKLKNLATDSRLLNAIGHLANSFHDTSVLCDIVKQFEMVNVHFEIQTR
jgi:hypothetical protein